MIKHFVFVIPAVRRSSDYQYADYIKQFSCIFARHGLMLRSLHVHVCCGKMCVVNSCA